MWLRSCIQGLPSCWACEIISAFIQAWLGGCWNWLFIWLIPTTDIRELEQNVLSSYVDKKNGVKQEGALSPIMFCVYYDEPIYRLRNTGMGRYTRHINYGLCGYVDEIHMLSPSITGLQKLVNASEEFRKWYDVSFNAMRLLIKFALNGSEKLFLIIQKIL